MKQSERIKLYTDYCRHPLREEYEDKKKRILSGVLPGRFYSGAAVFCIVMLLIYLAVVIIALFAQSSQYIVIFSAVLGVITLIMLSAAAAILNFYRKKPGGRNEKLNKLKSEYTAKGLHEFPENELFKHECCEYDDCQKAYVCCVTKETLNFEKEKFCKKPGNCRGCETFRAALHGAKINMNFTK